jgi:hypothetical protein
VSRLYSLTLTSARPQLSPSERKHSALDLAILNTMS